MEATYFSSTSQKSSAEERREPQFTSDKLLHTNCCWFFTWMLIGTLLSGTALGILLTLYIKPEPTTTTTTTTTTSTSTSTTSTTTDTTSTTSQTSTTTLPLVPTGVIMLWSGSLATVPLGWAVCDGTQGTPDLRNRFIIGSGTGAQYSPTQVGGSSTKTPTVTISDTTLNIGQIPSHSHGGSTGIEDMGAIYYDVNCSPNSATPLNTAPPRWVNTKNYNSCGGCQHTHTIAAEGGSQPHTHAASITSIDTTPPFIALLYIMKL
ncbi:hypothetical protein I4U23_010640 [Adineta vaga]|nr:hypothetical protein I4U23_010640 [Adineta vaga]